MTQQWEELPSIEQAAAWELVLPGSADRVLKQFEDLQVHKRRIEAAELRTFRIGQVLGFASVLVIAGVAWHLADKGSSNASAVVMGFIAALAGVFVAGHVKARRRDREPQDNEQLDPQAASEDNTTS
jgi:uncharacterized membrane protein